MKWSQLYLIKQSLARLKEDLSGKSHMPVHPISPGSTSLCDSMNHLIAEQPDSSATRCFEFYYLKENYSILFSLVSGFDIFKQL